MDVTNNSARICKPAVAAEDDDDAFATGWRSPGPSFPCLPQRRLRWNIFVITLRKLSLNK